MIAVARCVECGCAACDGEYCWTCSPSADLDAETGDLVTPITPEDLLWNEENDQVRHS